MAYNMKTISVFGLGYVGAVTAACLSQKGHRVLGVDVNPLKVGMLKSGRTPVLEPGLDRLVAENHQACLLDATTDSFAAVHQSDVSFICVGTPSQENSRLDIGGVEHCCQEIGEALRTKHQFHWIVLRSTVLPGTCKSLVIPTLEAASGKRAGRDFAVCSNPEFTREGCAVSDFQNPNITVLGASDPAHLDPLRQIYKSVSGCVFETSLEVAEMVKYVCNAFHALKVAFANEMGTVCKQLSVDEKAVMEIFISDTRLNISAAYLTPGFAFGGSCLPKDLRALTYCARQLDLDLPLLDAIMMSNRAHIERAVKAVLRTKRKKVGVLGLSFKAGTDDLRESPMVELIKRLLGEGCQVRVWDRDVSMGRLVGSNRQFIEDEIPHIGSLLVSDMTDAVNDAELILIGTKAVDENILRSVLRPNQELIDLVGLFSTKPAFEVERVDAL
jgi:GDP-mannose 6-dehydrogenase